MWLAHFLYLSSVLYLCLFFSHVFLFHCVCNRRSISYFRAAFSLIHCLSTPEMATYTSSPSESLTWGPVEWLLHYLCKGAFFNMSDGPVEGACVVSISSITFCCPCGHISVWGLPGSWLHLCSLLWFCVCGPWRCLPCFWAGKVFTDISSNKLSITALWNRENVS